MSCGDRGEVLAPPRRRTASDGEKQRTALARALAGDPPVILADEPTATGMIHVGDRASITSIAYPDKVFNGRVQQIADYAGARRGRPGNPAVNLGLKVVQVKIALDEPAPFKLGMAVDVKIFPQGQVNLARQPDRPTMRQLPVIGAPDAANVSFPILQTQTPDPVRLFEARLVQQQLFESSSHLEQLREDSVSAFAAVRLL